MTTSIARQLKNKLTLKQLTYLEEETLFDVQIEQDYSEGTTTFTFRDCSALIFCENDVTILE